MNNVFGFTNEEERYSKAIAWREAAIEDGWLAKATYKDEPIETASRLTKKGFIILILTRIANHKFKYEVSIHIWGPDGLAVKPPDIYNWEEIHKRVKTCNYCNTENVETVKVGFAGRCCKNCEPDIRKKVEFTGWDR